MKKSLMFLLVALSFSMVAMADGKPKAPERCNWDYYTYGPLYGDVASHSIYLYEAKDSFGEIEKSDFVYLRVFRFNELGDVVEENYCREDGSIIWKDVYKYDERRNTIAYTEYRGDGSLYGKTLWKYAADNQLLERSHYDGDGDLSYKYTYEYDADGNEIKMCVYGENYALEKVVKSKYVDGKKCEEAVYNGDGQLTFKEIVQYDDNGNVLLQAKYGEGGALSDKWVRTYGEFGVINVKYYDAEGLQWQDVYNYDARGNCIEYFEYLGDGATYAKSFYSYDDENRKSGYMKFNKDGVMVDNRVLEYDSKGRNDKVTIYDSNGVLQCYATRIYNDQDIVLQELTMNADGVVVAKSSWNDNGWITETVTYNNFGEVKSREVYTYLEDGTEKECYNYTEGDVLDSYTKRNDMGDLVELSYQYEGVEYRQVLEYDSQGYLVKWTGYEGHQTTFTYIYHNDSKGNVITSESYYSDILVPQHVFERKTVYR